MALLPILEDRLAVLECWLEEDPDDEELLNKQDEYLGMLEEVDVLTKKMVKTLHELEQPDQPNPKKYESRREQYEREFGEISSYVQHDPLFMDEQEARPVPPEFVKANSLLGKPLEDIFEMPGLEESIATLNYVPEATASSEGAPDDAAQDFQEAQKKIAVLQKKIGRVDKQLRESTDAAEQEKLQQSRDEYIAELQQDESRIQRLSAVLEENAHSESGDLDEGKPKRTS